MTAKEMFEKLEYKFSEFQNTIRYDKNVDYLYETIVFDKDDKTVYKQANCEPGDITLEELQAIKKQIDDLGW